MSPNPTIKRNVLFFNNYPTAYLWGETRYLVFHRNDTTPDHEGSLKEEDSLNDLKSRHILARDGLINWSVK